MAIQRRDFLRTVAAGSAAMLPLAAQQGSGGKTKAEIPTFEAKVEKLFKTPDRYPNALQTTPEAMWVGDQVSERVNVLDWKTGKSMQDFIAEAHNTSGLTLGGGYLWIGCNGAGTAAAKRAFDRPFDRKYGEIVQCDMHNGKQVKGYRTPWNSQHGVAYVPETDKLWAIAPAFRLAMLLDPKDNFRLQRMFAIDQNVPHGIEWYQGNLWIMDAAGRVLHKIDADTGKVLQIYKLAPHDPDPHGMCLKDDYVYYCDAGLGGGRTPSIGTSPQMVCRFPLEKS
jgi:hypothetical protein